ncbi:hypothetical protein NP493_7980g00001, partial [Ridgeia piscesae]
RFVAIIIGSLVGLVFLILSVVLGIHIVRTVRRHRVGTDSSENSEVLSKLGTRASVNSRLWQDRGKWMQAPSGTPLQDARDMQQLNVISKAMGRVSNIDWSIVRNFANRRGTRLQQNMHRGPEPMEWVRVDLSH